MSKMAAILAHPKKKKKKAFTAFFHRFLIVLAYIAFLVGTLKTKRWAFGLDVADATARVTLFGCDSARLCAC